MLLARSTRAAPAHRWDRLEAGASSIPPVEPSDQIGEQNTAQSVQFLLPAESDEIGGSGSSPRTFRSLSMARPLRR